MSDETTTDRRLPSKRLRSIGFNDAADGSLFDEAGFPNGERWDEIDFPGITDKHAFALEVQGDEMLPTYRDGDVLIISPGASIRRGDRVILKPGKEALIAGILSRRTAQRLELEPFTERGELRNFGLRDVTWLSRIIWARLGS
ncbi:MAG: S24 family peptidase [Geminicoccaceae bacterium]